MSVRDRIIQEAFLKNKATVAPIRRPSADGDRPSAPGSHALRAGRAPPAAEPLGLGQDVIAQRLHRPPASREVTTTTSKRWSGHGVRIPHTCRESDAVAGAGGAGPPRGPG